MEGLNTERSVLPSPEKSLGDVSTTVSVAAELAGLRLPATSTTRAVNAYFPALRFEFGWTMYAPPLAEATAVPITTPLGSSN